MHAGQIGHQLQLQRQGNDDAVHAGDDGNDADDMWLRCQKEHMKEPCREAIGLLEATSGLDLGLGVKIVPTLAT